MSRQAPLEGVVEWTYETDLETHAVERDIVALSDLAARQGLATEARLALDKLGDLSDPAVLVQVAAVRAIAGDIPGSETTLGRAVGLTAGTGGPAAKDIQDGLVQALR